MSDTTSETKSRFVCRHIHASGRRCRGNCLRGEHFCYYHHPNRRPQPAPQPPFDAPLISPDHPFVLPSFEDRPAIQLGIAEIARGIAANQIDAQRARLLLYCCQIAASNLPREHTIVHARPTRGESHASGALVTEVDLDPGHGPVAPVAEVHQPDPGLAADKPEPDPEPPAAQAAPPPNPWSLPSIQACAEPYTPPPATHRAAQDSNTPPQQNIVILGEAGRRRGAAEGPAVACRTPQSDDRSDELESTGNPQPATCNPRHNRLFIVPTLRAVADETFPQRPHRPRTCTRTRPSTNNESLTTPRATTNNPRVMLLAFSNAPAPTAPPETAAPLRSAS